MDRTNAASLTFVATLLLAVIAFLQWCTLDKTDETLRLTLNLSQRPWVAIEKIEARNWPTQVDGKVSFDLSVSLKNVGKSPATVQVFASAILQTSGWIGPQRKRCDDGTASVKRTGFEGHFAVVPDQVWPHHVSVLLETSLSDIQKLLGGKYVAMIVGCAVYQSTFAGDLYTTSFVGTTSAEDPKKPKPRGEWVAINISDRIPPKGRQLIIKDISMAGERPR